MRRPEPTPASVAFWNGVEAGRLAYPRCPACGTWHGYPRPACTRCLHQPLELTSVRGTGTVYAVTVVHRPLLASFADRVPYAHALVELDEGFRVLSLVVGCRPDEVRSGMRVQATIEAVDGHDARPAPLVLFGPAAAT
jgi:uncharacterized protein